MAAEKVLIINNERYDLNNISGETKRDLIKRGLVEPGRFYSPNNVGGAQLVEERSKRGLSDKKTAPKFVAGMLVKYKSKVYEVLEYREKDNKLSVNKGDKKILISAENVEIVEDDED